jgi:hypothetical protein
LLHHFRQLLTIDTSGSRHPPGPLATTDTALYRKAKRR